MSLSVGQLLPGSSQWIRGISIIEIVRETFTLGEGSMVVGSVGVVSVIISVVTLVESLLFVVE